MLEADAAGSMAAVWDRIKAGTGAGGGGTAAAGPPAAPRHKTLPDNGGGTAKGAYYGSLATDNTNNLNFTNGAKGYTYSIKGGPAPPRPPREFLDHKM